MNYNSEQLKVISYQLLDKQKEIAHFCTSREGGVSVGNYASFNMSPFVGDNPQHFENNKSVLCKNLGIEPDRLIIPYQTHGTEIREIDEAFLLLTDNEKANHLNGVDALFTKLPKTCIGVTTADCVPLLFFDPIKKAVATAHAGWRGTCAVIAKKTANKLIENFDCKPENILVTIGPSISARVYEVGKDVVEQFEQAGFYISEIVEIRNNSFFLDLWKANEQVLKEVGILPGHIEIAGICTFTEHEKFFSARRLGIKSGRMLSGIMIR